MISIGSMLPVACLAALAHPTPPTFDIYTDGWTDGNLSANAYTDGWTDGNVTANQYRSHF